MEYKYQNQVERLSFPNCDECYEIKQLINDPPDETRICGRMACSEEFWFFKDVTNSSKMAILGLHTEQADLYDGAKYHPDITIIKDTVFTVLSTVGPTGDRYTYRDIIQPLLFEATRHIQDRLVELSTERFPWLQLDEAAAVMAGVGFYRSIRQDNFKTIYIKYPLGSLHENCHLAPEHDTGLEFGYGQITDIAKLEAFDASSLHADKMFRKRSQIPLMMNFQPINGKIIIATKKES